jgi:hypothetical protein
MDTYIIIDYSIFVLFIIGVCITLILLWYTPKNLKILKFLRVISTLLLFIIMCGIFMDYSIRARLWWFIYRLPMILPFCSSLIVAYKVWYTTENVNMKLSLISTIAFIVLIVFFVLSFFALMSV